MPTPTIQTAAPVRKTPASTRVTVALSLLSQTEAFIAALGTICDVLPASEGSGIETAATDCTKHIWYNPAFTDKFTVNGLRDLMAHEIGHVLFMDSLTWDYVRRPNHALANIAQDFRINSFLIRAGFKFNDPAFGKIITIADAKKLLAKGPKTQQSAPGVLADVAVCTDDVTAEQIYDWLDEAAQQGGQGGQGGQGKGVAVTTGQEPRTPSAPGEPGQDTPAQAGQDQPLTPKQMQALRAQMQEAIRVAAQAAKQAGSQSFMADRIIGDYGRAPADWRRVLPRFVRTVTGKLRAPHRTYRRLSRRTDWSAPSGVVMPLRGRLKGSLGTLVVSIDVSGSIRDEDFNAIAANVQAMCRQAPIGRVHVLYFDTKILHHDEFQRADQVVIRNITAGGTDINVPFDWVRNNLREPPAAMVVFTDLEGPYPNTPPDYPVAWGITYNAAYQSQGLVPVWGRHVPVPCDG